MPSLPRGPRILLALAVVGLIVVSAASPPVSAALERPSYAPGDRWVYDLSATTVGLPGLNTTNGTLAVSVQGRLEVEVVGIDGTQTGDNASQRIRVTARASGFISGTFPVEGFETPGVVAGSFSSEASEVWEGGGYFPVTSDGTAELTADVTLVVATQLVATMRYSTNTTVDMPEPVFPLDVGETATADLHTDLAFNATLSFLGNTTNSEEEGAVNTSWSRQVLADEAVSVRAGSFAAYRLNQTLGHIPGLFPLLPAEGYEIAHFSSAVRYYVKRVAYVDGRPAVELELRSYSRAGEGGLSPALWALLIVLVAVVVAFIILLVVRNRRKRAAARARSAPGPSAPVQPPDLGGKHAR